MLEDLRDFEEVLDFLFNFLATKVEFNDVDFWAEKLENGLKLFTLVIAGLSFSTLKAGNARQSESNIEM